MPAPDHSATLVTIFEAGVTASGLRTTRQLVTSLIRRELPREELPAGTFGDPGQQEVLLAKTADRSVLGFMNDMAFRCEHVIADARPVACREAFRQIDGLAGPAGGKQTAEADLPDGKGVEQDFVPLARI